MVYAGMGSNGEDIRYATSSSPTGPWNFKAVLMGSQNSFTNHPGVVDYKGNSYFFYHTGNLPGGQSYRRSVCVEQFKYNTDGTIPSIPMTKNGPDQVGNLDPYVKTEAETICWESGVETEKCNEGGMNVGNIENGDYIKVKGVNFGSGAISFDARVASANSGGNIELRLDSPTGTLVGTCAVSGTGGWQTWTTKSCTVSGATGIHDLYLKFTGGSGYLLNINWWKFTSGSTTPTPTIPPVGTLGDINSDGEINSIDFALFRMHLLGITPLEGTALLNADVNKDGNADSIDFALIRKYLLGMIYTLPG
jgi:hypothetical protein